MQSCIVLSHLSLSNLNLLATEVSKRNICNAVITRSHVSSGLDVVDLVEIVLESKSLCRQCLCGYDGES